MDCDAKTYTEVVKIATQHDNEIKLSCKLNSIFINHDKMLNQAMSNEHHLLQCGKVEYYECLLDM